MKNKTQMKKIKDNKWMKRKTKIKKIKKKLRNKKRRNIKISVQEHKCLRKCHILHHFIIH